MQSMLQRDRHYVGLQLIYVAFEAVYGFVVSDPVPERSA